MGDDERADQRPPVWTGHLVLTGRDTKVAAEFYEAIGMRRIAVMAPFAVMELRGGTHMVVRLDPEAKGGDAPFDLMVEDLDATYAAWQAKGFTLSEIGKDERQIHRCFTVTDPDGNRIVVNDSHVEGVV